MLFFLCCLVWVAAALFGGATSPGSSGDLIVQALSIPLLVVAVWPALSDDHPNRKKARLALCAGAAIVIMVQIMPLPGQVWSYGGGLLAAGPASEIEADWPGWHTISLTPEATWAAASSLIVPLSIFGAVMQLGFRQRRVLTVLLLGIAALSLGLGFVQIAQGPGSALRFYDVTNVTEAVGFFANRNHFADFLSITLLLAGIRLTEETKASMGRGHLNSRSNLSVAASAAFVIAILAGLAVARSRAGLLFAMLALVGVFAIMVRQPRQADQKSPFRRNETRFSVAALLFGAVFVAQFGFGRLLSRFESDSAEDLRTAFNVTTWETALKALPFGTGLGSFVPVYAAVEKSQDIFPGYANRAHDDFAELFLETGIIGVVLALAFLVWFFQRSYRIWMQTHRNPSHAALERSATVAILLLLAHSLVDYPLRTTALSAVFAFFSAILAAPSQDSDVISPKRSRRAASAGPPISSAPILSGGLGAKIAWPEDWQRRSGPNESG